MGYRSKDPIFRDECVRHRGKADRHPSLVLEMLIRSIPEQIVRSFKFFGARKRKKKETFQIKQN